MADIQSSIRSVGELAQGSCIYSRQGRIYVSPPGLGELVQCSCVQVAILGIIHAYTQPITAVEVTSQDMVGTMGDADSIDAVMEKTDMLTAIRNLGT